MEMGGDAGSTDVDASRCSERATMVISVQNQKKTAEFGNRIVRQLLCHLTAFILESYFFFFFSPSVVWWCCGKISLCVYLRMLAHSVAQWCFDTASRSTRSTGHFFIRSVNEKIESFLQINYRGL